MDDTQASVKEGATAATRKRRSSILKSHRPPRTPFSELEFNLATPTDSAKSRRVSFSRRTGVAEFITNEATTTWKNFYEEHNKSLESSGNESAANAPRVVIGHIGKRIFDQQFEEIEVVDIGGTLQTNTALQEFQASFNNINLTQQLAAFECTGDDKKLCPPQQNFELSALTDHHSRVFGDELSIPVTTEMSNPININFSNIQPLGSNSKCDDLEEIQRDLERSRQQNVVCQGPFSGGRDLSEYIEIDLNMTNVGVRKDDCDMSITDTIHSPKVQDVVKSNTSVRQEKKSDVKDDWTVDKENIAVNPYATPKESLNFAVNEASNEVLVFDGKKLIVQSGSTITSEKEQSYVPTQPSIDADAVPKRKTITLNINDDLPNFIQDSSSVIVNQTNNCTKEVVEIRKSVIYNDFDLSITQAVDNRIVLPKRKTIVFEDDTGNISITQAVPDNVIVDKQEKRKTILYENEMNLSITQAVPTNIIKSTAEKRKTIVYEDGNISFTQAIPANLILNEKKQPSHDNTMSFQENFDMSVTRAIPENIIRSNISKMHDLTNLSMTQAIPSKILTSEIKLQAEKTIIYSKQQDIDIETTQAVPDNLFLTNKIVPEKRKTIVYDNEAGNISITQAIPTNILFEKGTNEVIKTNQSEIERDVVQSTEIIDNDIVKSKTVIFDAEDISFTKFMPSNIIQTKNLNETEMIRDNDISITRALPTNILQAVENQIKHENKSVNGANATVSSSENMMEIKNMSIAIGNISKLLEESKIYSNNISNLSITKPIPTEILEIDDEFSQKCEIDTNKSIFNDSAANQDILIYQTAEHNISVAKLTETDQNKSNLKENKSLNVSLKNVNYDVSCALVHSMVQQDSKKLNENNAITEVMPDEGLNEDKRNLQCINKNNTSILKLDIAPNKQDIKPKKSILNELLDMSYASSNDKEEISILENCNVDKSKNALDNLDINESEKERSALGNFKIKNTLKITQAADNFKFSSQEEKVPAQDNNEFNLSKQEILTGSIKENIKGESSESLFVITRDSENEIKTQNVEEIHNVSKDKSVLNQKSPKISFAPQDTDDRDDIDQEADLQQKVDELKSANGDDRKSINRHYEKIISSDLQKTSNLDKSNVKNASLKITSSDLQKSINFDKSSVDGMSRGKKSFRNADDTDELLEMLSDFTDSQADKQEINKSLDAIDIKQTTLENKNVTTRLSMINPPMRLSVLNEPPRLSMIPKRQSIVISREDLLTNISMAQAALQQSRFEMDDSESIEDTHDSTEDEISELKESPKKSVRMSMEVVKTLQFEEDDSVCDVSMNETKMSPLKKTAFGETTYMKEEKAKVIPFYEISHDIKALMHDLVKPTADLRPLNAELDRSMKKSFSTCSTQIQANLIASSQIDLDAELCSTAESIEEIEGNKSLVTEVASIGNRAVTHALRQSFKPISPNKSLEIEYKPSLEAPIKSPITRQSIPGPVITFDHTNPLNNILLTQSDCSKVHKYEPIMSTKNKSIDNSIAEEQNEDKKIVMETTAMQCNVKSRKSQFQSELQSGDTCVEKSCESYSLVSNVSKPLSIDRSTEGLIMKVKETEVNTLIAMKGNKDLLESNSSLTLVDDEFAKSNYVIKIDSTVTSDAVSQKFPLKVIYKMDTDEDLLHKMDSDFTSNEELGEDISANTRKRSYSPTKQDKNRLSQPNVEVTPKPISKMQKISNSPQTFKSKQNSIKIEPKTEIEESAKKKVGSEKKKSPKKKSSPKREDLVTVQQLITECYKGSSIDKKIDRRILEALRDVPSETLETETLSIEGVNSAETVVSVNSKGTKEMQDVNSVESAVGSNVSRVNWQTEVVDELSSKNLIEECSSSANVVAKIDMLTFMGRDCEWESSNSDVWVFRLLRSRIRLTARLAHTHHNASRSCVRADTALVGLSVDPLRQEERDPLASLTVRLATEAMRHECARCGLARDVPALLRRCAGLSRVALRWARVMRDARVRLAYTVTPDGDLTLKVANIPLRSVWEVRMRVEVAAGGAGGGAWARAGGLRAAPLLRAGAGPAPPAPLAPLAPPAPLARLAERVPRDWGHVPATIWMVFRYLKNKTREEDLLG